MNTYILLGKYTAQGLREIDQVRTAEAVGIVEQLNGQIVSIYALMGPYDIALIINLPGAAEAMQASVAISKLTGISFVTCPAMSVDQFDEFMKVNLDVDVPDIEDMDIE